MHVIGTAGHVDHGKSALVERLTGIDPDRFAEEKRRGLTIDLGFAWVPLPSGAEVGLIDVPGHERFISNMLAGAGGISICLFVVAANEGWKPQSAEHLTVVHTLGITAGVVALTKSDTVDDDELELVSAEVRERLAPSSLAGAEIVPCSAVTGAGIDRLLGALDDVVRSSPPAPDVGRARLWVDRVFTIAGAGTVVTGTLTGGKIRLGDEVELLPQARGARVRAIQSHKKEVSEIGPGNRTALNLAGLERYGAGRGDAVVHPGGWFVTRRFDAELSVAPTEITGRKHELGEKGALLLYAGSAETPVRVKLFDAGSLRSGERGYAQVVMQEPLPLARGDRFVLRDAGRMTTLGGGRVIDPLPSVARRRDAGRARLAEELSRDDTGALRALLDAEGGLETRVALFRAGLDRVPSGCTALGSTLVSDARFAELAALVRGLLERYHRQRPLEAGMARESLREASGVPPDGFDDLMTKIDGVVSEGAVVRLASHVVSLTPEQAAVRARVVSAIEGAGFAPPGAAELGADERLLRALTDRGELVRVGDFYLTGDQARRARESVRALIDEQGPVTVAQIRDLLGTTRKYAVPLCEWLDDVGVTRRRGDLRMLGPNA